MITRITSYNVCYTKLLRSAQAIVGWYLSSRKAISLEEKVFFSTFEGFINKEAITGI